MDEKKKTPKIRFAGFMDDWEQRKLGEYCEMYNGDRGINYPNDKDMVSDGIPFINAGDLKNGSVDLYTSNKITREKYSQLSGAKLQLGDIVYCLRGTLGKNAFIDNFNEGTVASSLVALRPKNIDGKYLFHILNSNIEFRQRTICDEGAAQPNLSAKNLAGFDIPIPKIEEQIKISRYLDSLDNLIILHQRKYNKLVIMKKSMLEKMFPKSGSDVPEIRFTGFTDAWEQRKWSDIFITLPNNSLSRAELNTEDGLIKDVHYGDVLIKYGEVLDVSKEGIPYISNHKYQCNNAALLQNGDVIIADAAEDETVGKCSEIAGLSDQKILSGLHTIPCRPIKNFSRGYLGYYMNSGSYHDQLLPLIQGTKISSISKSALRDTNILYPNGEEQEQIGAFFTSINNLITLHQRKLEKLKNIKKSMLEKMFV